jgi:hypothetical protein
MRSVAVAAGTARTRWLARHTKELHVVGWQPRHDWDIVRCLCPRSFDPRMHCLGSGCNNQPISQSTNQPINQQHQPNRHTITTTLLGLLLLLLLLMMEINDSGVAFIDGRYHNRSCISRIER